MVVVHFLFWPFEKVPCGGRTLLTVAERNMQEAGRETVITNASESEKTFQLHYTVFVFCFSYYLSEDLCRTSFCSSLVWSVHC